MTEASVLLAGREFAIRPLTLGQLRQVLNVVGDLSGKSGGELIESAARIIHAGLSRSESGLTLDDVLGMEATLDEVNAAVAAILRCAGLSPQEAGAGEGAPVATAEPSSQASTAPSPPAADIPIP